MADATNHLLRAGFYLVNFGIVSLFLKFGDTPSNMVEFIELMSVKIGVILLFLGLIHFANMFNVARIRKKSLRPRLLKNAQITASRP